MTTRVYVDFNELLAPDVILLSQSDTRVDRDGHTVKLVEGMELGVYSDDNEPDDIVADGVVWRNTDTGWSAHVKWVLKIDARGIRYEPKTA
ncbi:hypothetical protein AACH06_29570 [Ideonella sp. DXS29W]|uniref:Uncharacterized protein n=1 Tax=Ideonella lacteola TaxID=2984193 RepID=A0ABU9C2A7_9BURK